MTNEQQRVGIFLEELNEHYSNHTEISRIEFLGEYIFDFDTYDSAVCEKFATEMLDTIRAIATGKTSEYQADNYLTYLTMVNMPFLKDKLEWGMYIQGAWFCLDNPCTVKNTYIVIQEGREDIRAFIEALLQFATL